MNIESKKWIKGIVESEKKLYDQGIYDSILTNPFNKNLLCVFKTEKEVLDWLISLNTKHN